MKHTLPLIFIFFLSLTINAQSSFGDRFALEKDRAFSTTNTVKIFPNPAVDYIGISSSDAKVEQLVIYNLVGRKMKTFRTHSGDKYDIAELPKGMYLVQLLGKSDKIITTRRLQKQ